jgi:hypothetical protein
MEALDAYLRALTIEYDEKEGCYTRINERGLREKCAGLTTYLKREFYPNYKESRSKVGRSSRSIGIRVDEELSTHYAGRDERTLHPCTRAILAKLREIGHTIVATQVGVYLRTIGRITEADLICVDGEGRLIMYETKTVEGYVISFPPLRLTH